MVKLLGDMREVFEDFRFGDCDRHVPSMDRLQLKEEILRELRLHLGQRHVVTLNYLINMIPCNCSSLTTKELPAFTILQCHQQQWQ